MDNAQLVNLSRQVALERQMDVLSNNLANINTTGFKAETILFEEYVMPLASHGAFEPSQQYVSYTQDWASVRDFTAGSLVPTGSDLDVGLDGEGFLVVQTPEGERWTRNGAMHLDPTGVLVNSDGYPVMSEAGEIRFEPSETDIVINADGAISTSAGGKGRLRMVEFDNPQELSRIGSSLFEGGTPNPAVETRAIQGMLEQSNVSGVTEMANLIRVTRAYQSLANIMQMQDDLRQTAIDRLGDINA